MLKTCKDCGTEKPKTEFYGQQGECKECTKARAKQYRLDNIEKVREYDRNRPNADVRRKKFAAAHKERMKDPAYKEAYYKKRKEWGKGYILQKAANTIVGNAIRDKRLIKEPCEVCGEKEVDGHHDDYEKPLEVRWLCKKHHAEHHKELRDKER